MKIRVQLFAVARQAAGAEAVELDLPEGTTVAQLRAALVDTVPALAPLAGRFLFALDARYAGDAEPVPAAAEVACIPPVSGG